MGQSSSYDKLTVMYQFERKYKLALDGEVIDYERHMAYHRSHEVMLSELSEKDIANLSAIDEYQLEMFSFQVGGYNVQVKDALLAEALNMLKEKDRSFCYRILWK